MRWMMCLFLILGVVGCGVSQATLDEGKTLVQEALEIWKKGGKPSEITAKGKSVEFHEELWNKGEILINYEPIKAGYSDRDKVVRCQTRLTLRNRKGKTHTEDVTYDVTFGPPAKIMNNPMP